MKDSQALKILSKIISPNFNDYEELKGLISSLSSEDWEKIISIANRHQVITNIWSNLERKAMLPLIKDGQLLGYLEEMYNLNSFRNRNILAQVDEICRILGESSIDVVLLKGAAALSENHYEKIGERVMLDIDLLVPEDRIFEAIDILKNSGYREISKHKLYLTWHHYNRLYHPKRMTSLELHRYPLSSSDYYTKILNKNEHLNRAKIAPNSYIIKPSYELIHSFLHSQISHRYHKKYYLSLRHIHHFNIILNRYRDEIDIDFINSYMEKKGLKRVWREYCYINRELFNTEVFNIDFKREEEKYLKNIYYFMDNPKSIKVKVHKLRRKIEHLFSINNLKKHYLIKNRFYYYLYTLPYLGYSLKKFILDKKLRKKFLRDIGL